jgi:hypothetical protein
MPERLHRTVPTVPSPDGLHRFSSVLGRRRAGYSSLAGGGGDSARTRPRPPIPRAEQTRPLSDAGAIIERARIDEDEPPPATGVAAGGTGTAGRWPGRFWRLRAVAGPSQRAQRVAARHTMTSPAHLRRKVIEGVDTGLTSDTRPRRGRQPSMNHRSKRARAGPSGRLREGLLLGQCARRVVAQAEPPPVGQARVQAAAFRP